MAGMDAFTTDTPLVLVGAGKMGGAMLRGWIEGGLKPGASVILDPGIAGDMQAVADAAGLAVNPRADQIAAPRALVIAVKPQIMGDVLPGLSGQSGPDTLIISVAAGTPIAVFAETFGAETAIIRAMPNTPAAIGRGITVCCPNGAVGDEQRALCTALAEAVGEVAWVEQESLMDAVTAVSGSGPAYVFHMVECMTNAGINAGLAPDLARQLAHATVAGAGELVVRSGEEASTLRENVTSPNGTTQAALDVLMGTGALSALMRETVAAAAKRSRELAG